MWICMWISMWIWWFHVPNAGSWGLLQRQQTPAATGGDHPALQRGAKCWKHWKQLCNRRMSGWPVDQLWPVWWPWILLPNHVKSAFTGLLFFWKLWKTWNDGAALTILYNMILYSGSLRHGKHLLNLAGYPCSPLPLLVSINMCHRRKKNMKRRKAECAAQVLIRV